MQAMNLLGISIILIIAILGLLLDINSVRSHAYNS